MKYTNKEKRKKVIEIRRIGSLNNGLYILSKGKENERKKIWGKAMRHSR